jgi:hypothetical protein
MTGKMLRWLCTNRNVIFNESDTVILHSDNNVVLFIVLGF